MNTIELSKSAARSPQLLIANGADNINGTERPYAYFRRYLDQGAPWTFVVQNRTPHCCLQNAQILILDWLRGVLATPRTSWGIGKHGYLRVMYSQVNDEWKRPVFNATSARVSENIESPRDGELSAGWLPSATFADDWLAFVRRPGPMHGSPEALRPGFRPQPKLRNKPEPPLTNRPFVHFLAPFR